ncbi:hypothetical protein D3C72_1764830 [compost metagenome]
MLPSTRVPRPKTATPPNIHGPTWRVMGKMASAIEHRAAPAPGAVRSKPRPLGPICSTSCASAGSSAVAPPNRTANRSSEMAPSTMGFDQTKRKPSSRVCQLTGSRLTTCGAGVVAHISRTDTTSSADEIKYTTLGPK